MKECKEFEIFNTQLAAYCGKGVRSDFFKQVLAPSWWEKSMEDDRDLTISLAMIVAKKLGISLLSLLTPGSNDFLKDAPCAAYKIRANDSAVTMTGTSALLCATAKAVLSGIEKQRPIENDPMIARKEILSSAKFVDLYSLLDFCWAYGIPVLTMTPTVPGASETSIAKWHRPDGIVFRHDGKYCIFLPSNKKFQAQHLFYLAHELGHVALGHLKNEGDFINDDSITIGSAQGKYEQEANQYAISLLNGNYVFQPTLSQSIDSLVRWAIAEGREHQIDPGHLVLRNANEKSTYPLGMAALNRLNQLTPNEQKKGDRPITLVKSKAYQNLREEEYSDEQFEQISKTMNLTV